METPKLHRLPENQRRAILRALRLAQELGAETATLADPSEERAVLRYAREHNLGKIIIGRRSEQRWKLRGSFADRLGRLGPDLDLVIVALESDAAQPPPGKERVFGADASHCGIATVRRVRRRRTGRGPCKPRAHRIHVDKDATGSPASNAS